MWLFVAQSLSIVTAVLCICKAKGMSGSVELIAKPVYALRSW